MSSQPPATLEWIGDAGSGCLRLIEQTRLPAECVYLDCRDVQVLRDAIVRLAVRVHTRSVLRPGCVRASR